MGQLPRPVGAEVHVHHGIAVAHAAVDPRDHRRLDELVVLAASVGRLDRRDRVRRWQTFATDDRGVATGGAVPAAVAIHGEVATGHGRHAGRRASRGEARQEVAHEARRRPGRRVAPVEDGVHHDVPHPAAAGELGHGDQVAVDGVDAAGADEAHEMEAPTGLGSPPAGGLQDLVRGE